MWVQILGVLLESRRRKSNEWRCGGSGDNPSSKVIESIIGLLKNYIFSEWNALKFTVVEKDDVRNLVFLSRFLNFNVLGKSKGNYYHIISYGGCSISWGRWDWTRMYYN